MVPREDRGEAHDGAEDVVANGVRRVAPSSRRSLRLCASARAKLRR